MSADPFAHHPELRDKIADPLRSYLRNLTTSALAAKVQEMGLSSAWWHAEEVREAMRAATLEERPEADFWIFGYGSLMWDPGVRFADVRRAHAPAHERRFILKDKYGARGTADRPGLMAALDNGAGCDGLLFRIAPEHVEEESEVIWRRELLGPAYVATYIETFAGPERIVALAFMADHDAEMIDADLTREEQIKLLATGTGFMGSSLDYLRNIKAKFDTLGVHDEAVSALLSETLAYVGEDS